MKKYEAATIEIVEIRNDVIRTSGGAGGSNLPAPDPYTPGGDPFDF